MIMPNSQAAILNALSHKNCLMGRTLIYGGENGTSYWGADVFDPLYQPQMPEGMYDTIVCSYILCFLTPKQRSFVLQDILKRLNKGGLVYFTVTLGYHLPFRSFLDYAKFTTYKASHRSLTNWSNVYERQAIIERLWFYVEREDVLWEEWPRPDMLIVAQLAKDFRVILWREGIHQPDAEMVYKLKFVYGKSISYEMTIDGQLWTTAYNQSTLRDDDISFPVWHTDTTRLTLAACRELLDAAIKKLSLQTN